IKHWAVKESVFPFDRFEKVDTLLGPEMKSTGEVMGIGATFGEAFAKAQLGAGNAVPLSGTAFLSVRKTDRPAVAALAADLVGKGFRLVATRGTASAITAAGIDCDIVNKVMEGRPHVVDMIKNGQIALIVNTTEGRQAIADSYTIRRSALQHKVYYSTTIAGAIATCKALEYLGAGNVNSLQELHQEYAS
ncbi:MAG TPA: carbamoyl phosphate synthase large subunit, partial [Gammaproteobacteria bacterium]|nr:carbamoyl phosphate synthase large subunit [Gammaproteobacteria bacterium]